MGISTIENIGWTIGNDCPYRCPQCYSAIVRNKGRELTKREIDRIIGQIISLNIKNTNIGGNEPIFTNGVDIKKTLLPYIIRSLYDVGITIGLTTAGITMTCLEKFYPETLTFLNDVDVSLDSPFSDEHNANRGALLYNHAIKALEICNDYGISHTIVMCGMNWNLSDRHVDELVKLSKKYKAFVRINFIKPTEPEHLRRMPTAQTYFKATQRLLSQCRIVEMGESIISAAAHLPNDGCPCGTKSFRIHSITPDGKVPISPCVYAHDYKVGDLLQDDLYDIIASLPFQDFQSRREKPQRIEGCGDCQYLETCRGGCAARAYLTEKLKSGNIDLYIPDPYCLRNAEDIDKSVPLFKQIEISHEDGTILVHKNYLCTLILKPI